MISNFFQGFGCDSSYALVVAVVAERFELRIVKRIKKKLPYDRVRPIFIGLLYKQQVAKVTHIPKHSQRILVAPLSLNIRCQRQPGTRLTDQIQRNVCDGNILL